MQNANFTGLGVALVTPFNADHTIDFKGLKKLVEHQLAAKTEYLVVMGTTGESVTLDKAEKQEVLAFIQDLAQGKSKIVWGCGGNDTRKVAKEMASINPAGIDGILSVSPAYNKPTQAGIYQHYKNIASETDLPIILYNVPGRTGSNMTADTTLRLAHDVSNVVATKEASGDLEQVAAIIDQKPSDFQVISGDDALTMPILSLGGVGVISVVGNAFPTEFRNMIHATIGANLIAAQQEFYKVSGLIAQLFKEGNPGGIKASLKMLGICEEHMRMPLMPISEGLRSDISTFLKGKSLI